MTVLRLAARAVTKPWGRRRLRPGFADPAPAEPPVGEIWFEAPPARDLPLLVKYLFTSDNHSVQVHPDDAAARRLGHRRGKDEAWLVLDADADARVALGLVRDVERSELAALAESGEVAALLAWHPLRAGDYVYVPAGTIHALSGGLTLLEIQQHCDLTYRLYDYGRPRPLHVAEAAEAACCTRFDGAILSPAPGETAVGPRFDVTFAGAGATRIEADSARPAWLIPVDGEAELAGARLAPGECALVEAGVELRLADGGRAVIARAR